MLSKKCKFTKEEDRKIIVMRKLGYSWETIAQNCSNKSKKQCCDHFNHSLKIYSKKQGWNIEEDQILLASIKIYGKKWCQIAKILKTKTQLQIKNRYKYLCNHYIINV